MKKTLIALAVLAVSGAAFAQSSATISGSINVGIMDTGAVGATAGVAQLGNGSNAVNIITSEDLGGGLKGGFTSQMRFNAITGDMNSSSGGGNALFHAANAYISGGFGTVRVGKIAEYGHCAFDPWGCTGGAGTQAGAASTISALVASNTQASSVSYATPSISGFSAGYQTTVSARAEERTVLNIGYSAGPLALSFASADNSAASGASALTGTKSAQQSIAVGYNLSFGRVTFVNTTTDNAAGATTSDVTAWGLTVPMGAVTLLAGYAKDDKAATTADTKMAVGMNYALSKRTSLGADLFKQDGVGRSTGFVARVRHNF